MDTHLSYLPGDVQRFGGFTLDSSRARLTDATGEPVALRPKAFALLEYLVAHRGQVARRDEILDAVWPGVTVGDDSLTQAVAEIRRALGVEAARMIRTIPRRGYLFEPAEDACAAAAASDEALGRAASPASHANQPTPAASRGLRPASILAASAMLLAAAAAWLAAHLATPPPAIVPPETPRAIATRLHAEGLAMLRSSGPERRDWLGQRALFLRAIEADPSYGPAYARASITYIDMIADRRSLNPAEDMRRAEALSERASILAPDAAISHAARGAVLRWNGQLAEAGAAYAAAVARDPEMHHSRAMAGWINALLGRPEEALAPIRTSIALARPDHPYIHAWQVSLGLAQMHAGDGDLGAEALRLSAAGGAPRFRDERLLYLAAALALGDRLPEARALAAEVLAHSPRMTLGWFRERALSDNADYLAQREATLLRGLMLAGVPE